MHILTCNVHTYIYTQKRHTVACVPAVSDVSHLLNYASIREYIPLHKFKELLIITWRIVYRLDQITIGVNRSSPSNDLCRCHCWNVVLNIYRHTSLREFSSRRKSKTRLGETGSQKEVAALSTMPGGLPGSSMLFRVMTRTSSAPVPDSVVQVWAVEALTPAQKLITILSESFSMLFLPS